MRRVARLAVAAAARPARARAYWGTMRWQDEQLRRRKEQCDRQAELDGQAAAAMEADSSEAAQVRPAAPETAAAQANNTEGRREPQHESRASE